MKGSRSKPEPDRTAARAIQAAGSAVQPPRRRRLVTAFAAAVFGLGIASALAASAGLSRPSLSGEGSPMLVSGLAVVLVASLWFAGAVRLARIARRPAEPIGRVSALIAAFGAGPFLLVLFFYPIALALGFRTAAEAAIATTAALVALAPLLAARTALERIAEELLLSLFAWLALLVLPAFTAEPLARQGARLVLAALRRLALLP